MKFLIWIGAALVLVGGVGYGLVYAEKKRRKAWAVMEDENA